MAKIPKGRKEKEDLKKGRAKQAGGPSVDRATGRNVSSRVRTSGSGADSRKIKVQNSYDKLEDERREQRKRKTLAERLFGK